jgi:hypothetical protein
MFELFLNPWTMAAGAALVSTPIIIHLINRMRFRRVRWAAMEFLLKAQKRMRRKLIFEQLLLLLLRCLLVFLAGVLFARYLGFNASDKESRPTAHVVVLDDSPSMADAWRGDDGKPTTAFELAKAQLTDKILPAAAEAGTPQTVQVLTLSDLGNPYPRDAARITSQSAEEFRGYLGPAKPSAVRVGLPAGLARVKELLGSASDKETAKVVHVLTDLRAVDWVEDGEAVKKLLQEFASAGVKVHLVDVVHPFRKEDKKVPLSGENAAVVEFRPKARVAIQFQPVEFALRVKNFGTAELPERRVAVYVNGAEQQDASVRLAPLAPNQERDLTVTVMVARIGTKQEPLARFNVVSAVLENPENERLTLDNVRHAVIECRPRLAVLAVEGRPELRDDRTGDSLYLRNLFRSVSGIDWVPGTIEDLAKKDLRQYAAVYLLNVPAIPEPAAKNLEAYVRDGGGVGFFLGPDVNPKEYNERLYAGGNGLFPVELPPKPVDPPDEAKIAKRESVLAKRILLRDPAARQHPALEGLYAARSESDARDSGVEDKFVAVNVNQYWPVSRLGKWREERSVRELYCLANEQSVRDFEPEVNRLVTLLANKVGEPKFERYRKYITEAPPGGKSMLKKIEETGAGIDPDGDRTDANSSPPAAKLAWLLDRLLCDQINDGDESEPVLREFWALPEAADLRPQFQRLRDACKYGDPLYLARQFGQGRVTVVLTVAGTTGHKKGTAPGGKEEWDKWSDWPFSPSFAMVVEEMQKYLAGGGTEENRLVGSPVVAAFDPARYGVEIRETVVTFDPFLKGTQSRLTTEPPAKADKPADEQGESRQMESDDKRLVLRGTRSVKPGAYLYRFGQTIGPDGKPGEAQYLAYALNMDAAREGDLRRANRDDVVQQAPGAALHTPADASWLEDLKQKPGDLSSNRWLYLLILLVLLAEQAMAVRLSYHSHASDLESFAPSAASAFARGAPPAAGVEETAGSPGTT